MAKIVGTVFLKKINPADAAFVSKNVTLKLISLGPADGNEARLEGIPNFGAAKSKFSVIFHWNVDEKGTPEIFHISNNLSHEFFLESLTFDDIPNHGRFHFACDSWISPKEGERTFFINKAYLPSETPEPLKGYREKELKTLRGNGGGERQTWERIYDYDVYNDLGNPVQSTELGRPVLGRDSALPYPRRGRTGRPRTQKEPLSESIPQDEDIKFYVPRDEEFGDIKVVEMRKGSPKVITQRYLLKLLESQRLGISDSQVYDTRPINTLAPFDSFGDVREKLYGKNFGIPVLPQVYNRLKSVGYPDEFLLTHGEQYFVKLQFPTPSVIKEDVFAWMTDEEFARQMLAGLNPNVIRRIKDKRPLNSELPKEKLSKKLEEFMTTLPADKVDYIEQAIEKKKLFILDYLEAFQPYLKKINDETSSKGYATRTFLFLKDDGTLTPLVIELSLDNNVPSEYYFPAKDGVEGTQWLLAKAYVNVNDSGYHQLISHWLNTHAVIEPFIIATNRQLSVLHPVHKLLRPHFRDTMRINADARRNLISANGIIESSFFPGKYAMQLSSEAYKNWDFTEQALPNDLIKRGMAVKDDKEPYGLRLLIKDYPYATDGLEIWHAIKTWVQDYVCYYYKTNETIRTDSELKAWWTELKEVGHGDLKDYVKDKDWWPEMLTREDLVESCTIIIWIASALHAAVNFGQYPYGGYIVNRPTLSKRLMPGTDELKNKEKAFLQTFTPTPETLIVVSILEILSTHTSDEVYLGTRDNPKDWTSDAKPLEDFEKFKKKLEEIERRMVHMNGQRLKNRIGQVKMPYTLLYPSSEPGATGRGIPNSISI